jgi:hypothetical protein
MRRRTVLAGVTAALAGCQGTDIGTRTPEPPDIDCSAASRPPAEPSQDDEVEPQAYPEPPDGPPETAWVVDHESAFRINELREEYALRTWGGLAVRESEREPRGAGTVVRIAYTYGFATDDVIADSPGITAAYYVDERGALRAAESAPELASDLDPVADGEPVVCF